MSNRIRNAQRKREKALEVVEQETSVSTDTSTNTVEIYDEMGDSKSQKVMNVVNGLLLCIGFFVAGYVLVYTGFDTMASSFLLDGLVIVLGLIWYFMKFYKGDLKRRSMDYQYNNSIIYLFLSCLFLLVWFSSQAAGLWYYAYVGDSTYDAYKSVVTTSSPSFSLIIFTILVAPVCEEVLCRALVHNYLKRTMRWVASILLTSVLFALLHGTIVHIVVGTMQGIVFNLAYELTRDLRVNITFHIFNNACAFVPFLAKLVPYENTTIVAILFVVSIIGIVAGFLFVNKCNYALKKKEYIKV